MKRKEIKIVFTDLDRTLLKDDNTFFERNLQLLEKCGIPKIDDAKKRLAGLLQQWT